MWDPVPLEPDGLHATELVSSSSSAKIEQFWLDFSSGDVFIGIILLSIVWKF